ncbi:hypothetical protein, partial [Roseiconus lacunae]|uniref:hypothetical protein n=1 Tax=Roseiconus lacunae TaxID=2605694 RepID=UPI001F1FC47A
VPSPIDGPLCESPGTTKVTCVANHQAIIRLDDDDLSTRDIKSNHQEMEVASTSMGRPRSPYLACALS